jgi:glycosyltransferase involved in cell wall biosynthesis
VSALMAAADFLVCPSRHEPLGNVVIEGWAAGLPVVATASDGPAGLIEEGSDGLLVPLTGEAGGAAEALADAMQRLAGDAGLRARLAEGGRAAYEASFTEAVVVGRYRAFFDEVAG